ncbi:MAG: histidine triad nucleotide-binding protein [Pseudomonadota bacterium]
MSTDCLFCRIVAGEISVDRIYESETVIGFKDINPQAPIHVLFIPRKHIATLNDADAADRAVLGDLLLAARHYAAERGIAEDGFRVAMNCNRDGGQTVFHIHLHMLAGRSLSWPPG